MIHLPDFAHSLIVSCQAPADSPLRDPSFLARMALAAEQGGARGIRADGVETVSLIRQTVTLPIIGILKTVQPPGGGVFITPTFKEAALLAESGADMIALDGTARPRPDGRSLRDQIARIHDELGLPVMADTDGVESAMYAEDARADVIGTTLAGYTGGTVPDEPSIDLVHALASRVDVPVIAEGRIWTRDDASAAILAGAWAVVVGTAITNPVYTAARFAHAIAEASTHQSRRSSHGGSRRRL
ncbi:N-acetylmannosamine-6-phosphate 2-epimerase [Subtercola boreus]|uniref:N-acylglucosamine-6-phosphate 2-epimerase n=1 Tax=Subtercola boreus TaxID=120213 RepID=A0A3E0W9A0_9MICO|nr:N-acetylmannosamine-6-phosphate 2-epimerase [Subtercola boreus]RFA18816.1 hypothetical protein B7R24_13850 [Subtercola boreus]RFA18930.1 hypothetical protein B7R23_13840 [Subtercola boreus]RFA25468.1 hypothetical protein B7R25_13950 [Subtercola boreus]